MSKQVPAGWQIKTLEHCCDVLDSQRVPVNSIERSTRVGKYPYYGANGIQGYIDDYIFDDHLVLLAEDGGHFDEYATRPICYMVKGKCWVNNHAHILKAKNNIYTELLHYSLVHKNILTFINGGTRAKLNQSDLLEIPILLPPLPEQRKIAAVLSSADRSIAATEKLIAKLADLKKALMQQLLTKGIGHPEFKPSPLGPIPKSWEVVKLGKIAQIKPGPFGSSIKKSMYVVSGYKIYGQEQVIAQSACIGNYYIDEQKFEELKAFTVKAGDILMSLVGTLGKVLVVPKNHEAGIINPRLVKMTFVPQKASSIFFKHLLASILIQNQIAQGTQGGTMGVLNGTILKEINIVLPPINEQIKIADILDGIDRKLSAAKVKLAKAKDLKQGLMNDLLTGKVRVKI